MALMLIGFGISASAQNFGLGVNLGYGSEIEKPSFGIKALYDINESFTLTPSFNYYLKEEVDGFDINFWDINLDLHWNCYDADMYQLYPLAGVTYLKGKVRVCKINCVTQYFQFKTHRSGNAQRQGAGPPVPTSDKIRTT